MAGSFGIVGCGYVGSAVATHLRRQGHEVVGTTTSPERLAELCDLVDHPRLYSAGDPMADASFLDRLDGVLIAMAPTTATFEDCLLYTSPSPRDMRRSRMPSSA